MKKTVITMLSLLVMTMSVRAQDNIRAIGAAMDTITRVFTMNNIVDRIADDIYRRQPSAALAARIGKSYYNYVEDNESGERNFYKNDTARAFYFIREAIKLDKTCAPAYVLAGDILAYQGMKDEAIAWLNDGIKHNPTDSTLYKASNEVLFNVARAEVRKSREAGRTDVDFMALYQPAIDQLKKLKEKDPNYPLDLELGRFYYKLFDKGGVTPWVQMAESYGRADRNSFSQGDFQAYALALTQSQQFSTGVDITEFALKKYPEDHALNQAHFFCALGLAQNEKDAANAVSLYKKAVEAADKYFAVGIKSRFDALDYLRYGEAHSGAKSYDKAIKTYNDVLKMPGISEKDVNTAYSKINYTVVGMAYDYINNHDFDQAFAILEKYISELQTQGRLDYYLFANYARAYMMLSSNQEGEQKMATLQKASDVYSQVITLFPDNEILAVNSQFTIHVMMDSDSEAGLAKPYAEKLIALVAASEMPSQSDLTKMASAYEYLTYYYFIKHKWNDAVDFADKVLAINPNSDRASRIKDIAIKYAKRR